MYAESVTGATKKTEERSRPKQTNCIMDERLQNKTQDKANSKARPRVTDAWHKVGNDADK